MCKKSKALEEKTRMIFKRNMKVNMSEEFEENFEYGELCWMREQLIPNESQYYSPFEKDNKRTKQSKKKFQSRWELEK